MAIRFYGLKPWDASDMGADDWEKFYSNSDPWQFIGGFNERIRNQIIVSLIRWGKVNSALDIACGEGSLTRAISPFVQSMKAFDISSKAIKSAKEKFSADNIEYFQYDMKDFSHSMGNFDLILCAEVIYYLKPPEIDHVLTEIGLSLNKGGYFILTTRTDYWFGFQDFVELLQERFRIITIVPVWRPETAFYRGLKRIFSLLSPWSDRAYRSWLMSLGPHKAGMCAYVCINK